MERTSGKLLAASLAFALWGGWALVVNRQAGWQPALLACLLQGTISFVITLIMAAAVTWQVRQLSTTVGKVLVPPLLTVSVTGSFLYAVHTLVHTPDVWPTIIPPSTVALFYCLFLSIQIQRQASLP